MKITKETIKRALRTFLQAALAYITANIVAYISGVDFTDKEIATKAVIGLITSAGAAGIAAVMNLEKPPEQLGGSTLTFSQWIDKYIGKKTDWDGAYGIQCVDLIDCYIAMCLGLKKGFWGNAVDWWEKRNNSAWLKANFEFIKPTYKNGELKPGDIGIRTSGSFGHIFVVADTTANGKIKYYDQNYKGTGAGMTLREMPYDSTVINGVLRPKNQKALGIPVPPTFKSGKVYTLNTDVNVRIGAGTDYSIKKVKDLTADGKKNATSKKATDNAVLKKGTKVTAQQVINKGSDIWLKIPSGYIAVYYNGSKYAV